MSLDFRLAHSIAVQRMRRGDLDALEVADSDIVQISMIEALLDGCYDGDVTVGELRGRGDFGLGTLAGLDGELVIVDGEFWSIGCDGVCHPAPDDAGVPFAAMVSFEAAEQFTLDGPLGRAQLEAQLLDRIDDPDGCFALRIHGRFAPVTFRSVARQTPPYRPLAEVMTTDETLFTAGELTGTMVGFYFPDLASEVNQPGFHLHMVTDDRATGGHVYDFTLQHAEVLVGRSHNLHVELPERGLAEVLTLGDDLRRVHLHLVRSGDTTAVLTAQAVGCTRDEAADALRRLANRGMADEVDGAGHDTRYRPHLAHLRPSWLPPALDDL